MGVSSCARYTLITPVYKCVLNVTCVPLCEKKRKEKTTPFGVSLMRSQVLYRAAQAAVCSCAKMYSNIQQSTSTVVPTECSSAPIKCVRDSQALCCSNNQCTCQLRNLIASPGTDPFAHCHTHMSCALQQQLLNQGQASPDSVTWMM